MTFEDYEQAINSQSVVCSNSSISEYFMKALVTEEFKKAIESPKVCPGCIEQAETVIIYSPKSEGNVCEFLEQCILCHTIYIK